MLDIVTLIIIVLIFCFSLIIIIMVITRTQPHLVSFSINWIYRILMNSIDGAVELLLLVIVLLVM